MLNNWHRTEHDLNSRRQELLAEAAQHRLARLSQSAQPRLKFSLIHRVVMRLKWRAGSAQPRLNQQPAA